MDVKKQFGAKIKRLRAKYGYTQEELAEKMQIATRTLCGIENGENFVKAETIEKFCEIFDVSMLELMSIDHIRPQGELVKEIIKDIHNIKNREKIETLYKIVKSLKID